MKIGQYHSNTYKLVRSYKLSKQKLNQIFYRDFSMIESSRYFEIPSCAVIVSNRKKNFQINIQNNDIYLYDSQTYIQANFNRIYKLHQKQQVCKNIQKNVLSGNNYTLLYFQTSVNNNKLFINNQMLNKSILQETHSQQFQQQIGIVEKSIQNISSIVDRNINQELLVSVIGFSDQFMIDLLNFQIDTKSDLKLKILKQSGHIVVQNLTQIGIEDVKTFLHTFSLCSHLKKLYQQSTGNRIQAQVYQICIGKLSKQKQTIQFIRLKYNFVKLYKDDSGIKNSLGNCLKVLTSTNKNFIPSRNSKLSFFLEDCLNKESKIEIMYQIDNSQNIKYQIQNLSFNSYLNKRIIIKKNYFGDDQIIKKIKKTGNKNQILNELQKIENQQLQRINIKKGKLGEKYDVRINRSILADTQSSFYKRKSVLQKKNIREYQNFFSNSKRAILEKFQIVRNAYGINKQIK